MKTMPSVDVLIVGGGWSGLLMAKELGTRTALSVVVLERGGPHETADYIDDMDELDYAIRHRLMQDFSQETVTLRHSQNEKALPLRQHGAFLPGTGVGGAGEHWGGLCMRMLPDSFEPLTKTIEKHGAKALPEDHSIQDWGVTYREMEPYYARAELLIGASGKAGNLRGKQIEGGNIFEGSRDAEFPTPPSKIPYISSLFRDAAQGLGYHPYPASGATLTVPYKNPDGISRSACAYCGYCIGFGCMIGAKAQPTNTLLPVIKKHNNVSIRAGASVRRLVYDPTNKPGRVRGVMYVNEAGEQVLQPAELVFLASWTVNNTRLLLLSSVGEPYSAATGKGNVGRNLTHQVQFPAAIMFFEKPLNRFMGSGTSAIFMHDLESDIASNREPPFLGGGVLQCSSPGDRPIASFGVLPPSVTSRWGSEWKKAATHYYDRTGRIAFEGKHLAYKTNFMDLDPVYKDRFGDPLVRLTLDWRDNEKQMVESATRPASKIAASMGAKDIVLFPGLGHYDARRYQSTHVSGGAILGTSPSTSVINPFLQHWQVENLFVLGGSSFPQNSSAPPTLTILAQTLRTADFVVNRYLRKPGPLA